MSFFHKDDEDDRNFNQKLWDDIHRREKIEEFVYEEADYLSYLREQERKKKEESEKRHSEAFEETTQSDTKIAEPEEETEENNDDFYDDIISDQEQEILELKEQIENLQNQLSGKSKQKISLSDKVREVEIVFPDGSTTKRTGTNIILDGNYCLVAPGGKTYHSLVSCYLNWPEEFRNSFSHWNIITKEEAKQQNFKECKFCKESRKLKESIDNEIMLCEEELIEALKRNHSFEEFRITKTNSEEAQENIDSLSIGDELSFELDDDNLQVMDSFGNFIGAVPAGVKDKLEQKLEDTTEYPENLTSYVSEIDYASSGKTTVKIVTITEDPFAELIGISIKNENGKWTVDEI